MVGARRTPSTQQERMRMESYQDKSTLRLSANHHCMLLEESGISLEVAPATGSLLAPVSFCENRKGKLLKHRTTGGSQGVLEGHHPVTERTADCSEAADHFWVTEGGNKAHCLTGRSLTTVGLTRMRNWQLSARARARLLFTLKHALSSPSGTGISATLTTGDPERDGYRYRTCSEAREGILGPEPPIVRFSGGAT